MGMGTGRVCSKEQERGGQVAGEQDFAYEKTEKGIRILRCYGVSSTVSVPGELEGLPVTELADYAFADGMENEPENTSGLPCICGNDWKNCTCRKASGGWAVTCFTTACNSGNYLVTARFPIWEPAGLLGAEGFPIWKCTRRLARPA